MGVERERAVLNQARLVRVWPRQRSIIPRWKNLSASCVPRRSALREYAERLRTAAVARERPREHVVPVDRRPLGVGQAGAGERMPKADAVIDLEEGDLEVGLDAVRVQQLLDRADQRVLAAGERGTPGRAVEVAEGAHVLRQWDGVDRPPLERDRAPVLTLRREHLCERVEAVRVAREGLEGEAVLPLGQGEPPVVPVQLAELDVRPGGRLGPARRGVDGELHRPDRRVGVADQLASVRDACVGGEARAELVHAVERPEGLGIAAELDERVADHAVGAGRVRVEGLGLPPEDERLAEAMAGERQRAEPADGEVVLRVEGERAAQHALRLRVVRGVAGLTRELLVAEPEEHVRVLVLRVRAEARLELGDEGGRARVQREAGLEVLGRLGAGESGRGRGRRLTEEAAEQRAEGDGGDDGGCDQDSLAHGARSERVEGPRGAGPPSRLPTWSPSRSRSPSAGPRGRGSGRGSPRRSR